MAISPARLNLCKAYLDDCYERYTGELTWSDHTIANYARPEVQANYTVMYFAKSLGCWWGLRDLLDPSPGDSRPVVSIGAGPMFCLMGWFFSRPPARAQEIIAIDALEWEGVRSLPTHTALLSGIMGRDVRYYAGGVFPASGTPQAADVDPDLKRIATARLPEGCTVLLPMVMNHVVGATQPVRSRGSLAEWLRGLEQRAGRIVLVDMQCDDSTSAFWAAVAELVGLSGAPNNLNFANRSTQFAPCYGDRFFSWRKERDRRTGAAARHFCDVAGCAYEPQLGWSWISRS